MRIAIIGLGLIGGSIGLALRQANWQEVEIIGYVRRPEMAAIACQVGAINRTETSLEKTVQDAELVVIATPVLSIKDILTQIAPHLSPGCIVTDAASTKVQVMQWAQELLPKEIDFIGGHPMAGKETFSIEVAEPDLFHNCIYCLTPAPQVKQESLQTIMDMAKAVGATPLIIDAQKHDNLVAGISHLPLLLSVALVLVTTQNPSWQQMSELAATGYRDLTRLASGSPEINAHTCLTNQADIVSWLDDFIKELRRLRQLVADGGDEIEKALAQASEARQKWLDKHC